MVAKALPGDSEKYLGTVLALATGNPLFAGIGALADPDAGFGDIATAAFLASQSPGIKGLTGSAAKKGTFMDTVLGRGKEGAGGFAEFFLGKKGVGDVAGTPGLFGEGGKFIPTKQVEGADGKMVDKIDASKLLNRIGLASGIFGATAKPFGLFDVPEMEQVSTKLPGSDYQATALNLTPGQLLDLQLGGGIVGPYYNMQGNLVQNAAKGGLMQDDMLMMAQGGTTEFPRKTGEISGPGTGTSDSIPAMLSDGEFVMTAKAVRGAGNGDRMEGARKMYQMMDQLEAQG